MDDVDVSLQVRRDEQALSGQGHLRRCACRHAWVPVSYAPVQSATVAQVNSAEAGEGREDYRDWAAGRG
jgi:hypothetical protein